MAMIHTNWPFTGLLTDEVPLPDTLYLHQERTLLPLSKKYNKDMNIVS